MVRTLWLNMFGKSSANLVYLHYNSRCLDSCLSGLTVRLSQWLSVCLYEYLPPYNLISVIVFLSSNYRKNIAAEEDKRAVSICSLGCAFLVLANRKRSNFPILISIKLILTAAMSLCSSPCSIGVTCPCCRSSQDVPYATRKLAGFSWQIGTWF